MATSLTLITGIGPAAAAILKENGFTSVEDIAKSDSSKLSKVPGFALARSEKVLAAARALVPAKKAKKEKLKKSEVQKEEKGPKKEKKSKKEKKAKKDKKSKKDKKAKKAENSGKRSKKKSKKSKKK